MNKFSKILVAAAVLVGLVSSSQAVTVTNADGTVFTINRLDMNDGPAVRSAKARQDQSTYANQDKRAGIIVRTFDSAVDNINGAYYNGGTAGVFRIGSFIPSNAIITADGWIEVLTAVTPATNIYRLEIVGVGDTFQASTNLASTGLKLTTGSASVAPSITNVVQVSTGTNYLQLVVQGDAGTISTGKFNVYLPYISGQ